MFSESNPEKTRGDRELQRVKEDINGMLNGRSSGDRATLPSKGQTLPNNSLRRVIAGGVFDDEENGGGR